MGRLQVDGSGDLVMAQELLKYGDGSEYHGVTIFEIKDGRIAKETGFFGPSFEAPEWRRRWVERIEEMSD